MFPNNILFIQQINQATFNSSITDFSIQPFINLF